MHASPHPALGFEPHFFECGGYRLAYLDEGPKDAPPILMIHGNPTWSFLYRNLVRSLRHRFRCLALDHAAMGLSDVPPPTYGYRAADRVRDMTLWIDSLGLTQKVGIVAHDWGGLISTAWAVDHASRVSGLCMMNTAAFRRPAQVKTPWALRLGRSAVGKQLIVRANAFSAVAARVCAKSGLSQEVRDGFTRPYQDPGKRWSTYKFVEDIPDRSDHPTYPLVHKTEQSLGNLAHLPVRLIWGLQDFVFGEAYLREWQRFFPNANTTAFADGGHYVLEDHPEAIAMIETFFEDVFRLNKPANQVTT